MTRNHSFSITGKNINSIMSLKGFKSNESLEQIPIEVKNIKIMVMNLIILPFISKQWKKLEENICFLDILTRKIDSYLSLYADNEYLLLYKNLLVAFETSVNQHLEINNLEKHFKTEGSTNAGTMVFKTTMVRFKAEYELYNLIVGKPQFKNGEKYKDPIILDIVKLLDLNTINFDYMKKFIREKYNIKEDIT
jgi:hypothetical protein